MLSSSNDGKEPINFANPDDPRAKQYYQKFHAEIEASIAAEIEIYRSLSNYIFDKALERKKEDIDFEEQQKHTQEVMKVNAQLAEASQTKPNDERVIDELKKTLDKLHDHISMLEFKKTQLSKSIVTYKSEIDLAGHAWVQGREKAVNNIADHYQDIINDPKLRQRDGMIVGADNKALSRSDFANLLDRTASSDLKNMAQALNNHEDVSALKYNVIDRVSQDESLSEKEQLQLYAQASKAEGVLQHIRILNDLGGGNVTPTEMLILMKRERLLGILLAKLGSSTLNQDIEAFKSIHQKLNQLESCQKKMNKTDDEINQFRNLVSDVEESINKLDNKAKPEYKR